MRASCLNRTREGSLSLSSSWHSIHARALRAGGAHAHKLCSRLAPGSRQRAMAHQQDIFAVARMGTACECGACQVTQSTPRSVVLVPSELIDAWLMQLSALPPRKWSSWKGRVLDGRGVASRVRFRANGCELGPCGGCFQEYNTAISSWLPILPYESVRAACTSFTPAGLFEETTDTAMRQGDYDLLCTMYAARSSGRPRRNHWVSVPTRPGEPTRG